MWSENIDDLVQYLVWVESRLEQRKRSESQLSEVQQIVDEGEQKVELALHQVQVVEDLGVYLGHLGDELDYHRDEENRSSDRGSHLVRDCRRERLGLTLYLHRLLSLHRSDLLLHFGGNVT